MITVGTCRICETGPLGLRLCGGCQSVLILCNECDAAWIDSHCDTKPAYADEESMPCPHCEKSLWDEQASWLNREEIDSVSWITDAIKEGTLVIDKSNNEAEPPNMA